MSSKRKPAREPAKPPPGGQPLSGSNVAKVAERAGYQAVAAKLIQQHPIVFLLGPAGCGKTWVATSAACRAVQLGHVSRVIVTRPAVECGGERLGFVPGEMTNKMHGWLLPFADVLRNVTGVVIPDKTLASFEAVPLGMVRGRTFSDCVAVLDEAQNASIQQLRAYLTRIGEGGKLIICGDPGQSDLPGGGPHLTLIADEMEKRGLAGVVRFPPSAVVRHPLIQGIEQLFTDMRKK